MATHQQIQNWVKQQYGFVPKTCWIADVKNKAGLPMHKASNRQGTERAYPCLPEKAESIRSALRHFGIIIYNRWYSA